MNTSSSALLVILFCGYAFAVEVEENTNVDEGTGKLYFTGPGYTINLIPQAILLGLLSFLAVYFLGLDLFGTGGTATSGYGAPEPSYGAPAPSYSAPATGYDAPSSSYAYNRYDTDAYNSYDDARKKRSAF